MRAVGMAALFMATACGGEEPLLTVEHTCFESMGDVKVIEEYSNGSYYWTANTLPKDVKDRSVDAWTIYGDEEYWSVDSPERTAKGEPIAFCDSSERRYRLVIH